MPAKKGSHQRTNWRGLRKRFLSHEWETVEQMCEATRIPLNTAWKHTGHWKAERNEIDEQAHEAAKELILANETEQLTRMMKRQMMIIEHVQMRSGATLLKNLKIAKGKKGKLEPAPFIEDGLALMGLRLSGATLSSLMRRSQTPSGEPEGFGSGGLGGPVIDIGDEGDDDSRIAKLPRYSPDQLRQIIGGGDAGDKPSSKKSGR